MATETKRSEAKRDEFDYRPVVPGATVPLRRCATKRNEDGSRDSRMSFGFYAGGGEIEGVPFRLVAALGGSVEVRFTRPGADVDDHAYEVSATDVVKAAFEVDRARSAGVEPAPAMHRTLHETAGSLAEIEACFPVIEERVRLGQTTDALKSLALLREAVSALLANVREG